MFSMKKCTTCKQEFPPSGFYIVNGKLRSQCIECFKTSTGYISKSKKLKNKIVDDLTKDQYTKDEIVAILEKHLK